MYRDTLLKIRHHLMAKMLKTAFTDISRDWSLLMDLDIRTEITDMQ